MTRGHGMITIFVSTFTNTTIPCDIHTNKVNLFWGAGGTGACAYTTLGSAIDYKLGPVTGKRASDYRTDGCRLHLKYPRVSRNLHFGCFRWLLGRREKRRWAWAGLKVDPQRRRREPIILYHDIIISYMISNAQCTRIHSPYVHS
jgi:hypothetical protein